MTCPRLYRYAMATLEFRYQNFSLQNQLFRYDCCQLGLSVAPEEKSGSKWSKKWKGLIDYKSRWSWDSPGTWFVSRAQLFHQRLNFFQPLDSDFFDVTNFPFGPKNNLSHSNFPSHFRIIKTDGTGFKCPHVSVSPGDPCELFHESNARGNTLSRLLVGNLADSGPDGGVMLSCFPQATTEWEVMEKMWEDLKALYTSHPQITLTQWHPVPKE